MLHRDVKPTNVGITRSGRVVLQDFGLAGPAGEASTTRTGALVGTPRFMAPEAHARGGLVRPRGLHVPHDHRAFGPTVDSGAITERALGDGVPRSPPARTARRAWSGWWSSSADLYLALGDSREHLGYTAVAHQHLRAAPRSARARREVVVLDCCFSGRAARALAGDEVLAAEAAVDGAYVLTASPRDRIALAPDGERYTAFTGELLGVLRHGVQDGPEPARGRPRLPAPGRPAPGVRQPPPGLRGAQTGPGHQ